MPWEQVWKKSLIDSLAGLKKVAPCPRQAHYENGQILVGYYQKEMKITQPFYLGNQKHVRVLL